MSVYVNKSCNPIAHCHSLIFPLKWFRRSVSEPGSSFYDELWYLKALKHFVSLICKISNFKRSNSFSAFASHTNFWVAAILTACHRQDNFNHFIWQNNVTVFQMAWFDYVSGVTLGRSELVYSIIRTDQLENVV